MDVLRHLPASARRVLPYGQTLPDDAWRSRHVAIVGLLWLHALVVPVFALVRGLPLPHVLLESSILPATAVVAMWPGLRRSVRTVAASLGLLFSSAILVHLSGGVIEMHFHFFVMVAVVALYQDWLPFLAAIGYVFVHHGVMGVVDPNSVYNHAAAQNGPWKWAAIHAFFVSGISVACLVNWRFNEAALSDRRVAEERLREESRIAETLHRVGESLAADLDLHRVVQTVTDATTEITSAAFGAFFYNVLDNAGGSYMLYTLSGAPIEAFERFGLPRNTKIFAPTFSGTEVVRLDDVTADPRYGRMGPHHGMPEGHLPVRSYLAVPVRSRGGEVLGGLFFGHPEPARFTAVDERIVVGVAAQAAMAFDNARLYESERLARTASEAAGARLAALAEASKILTSSLEVDAIVRDLARLVVPDLADYCVLELVGEDGGARRVAVAGGREWTLDIEPGDPGAAHAAAEADPAVLRDAVPDPGYRALLEADPPTTVVAAPLTGRAGSLGTLWLATARSSSRRLDPAGQPFADELARRVAVAVENARLYARQRTLAETLQHSLLPDRLPSIPGIETAARYLAGGPDVEVGGDWYDVIQLPGGKIGLAIGDVVGRGERAAALMGQLRSALRAYGTDGRSPGEVLVRLNALLLDSGPEQMATVFYVVLDTETGELRFANAGHPPPLLASPGSARFLDDCRGVPVGALSGAQYAESTAVLEPGGRLLLYTDGLVEDRAVPIDVGLQRLREAVLAGPDELDPLCARVLEQALGGRESHDDTAVLAVRLQPLGSSVDFRLPASPTVLAPLRATVRRWLRSVGADETETYELLVATGELFTNAIRHSGGTRSTFEVHAEVDGGGVAIRVRNPGRWRAARGEVGGRGLGIVEAYADTVDVVRDDDAIEVRMRRGIAALQPVAAAP